MRTILALLCFSAFAGYANAQVANNITSTGSSGTHFTSPLSRNIDSGTHAPQATSEQGRCRELNVAIAQAIASPDRKNVVVRGYGPDGKEQNEPQVYDKRGSLEAEYRKQGCQ
jgi:hypothetical protein